MCAAEEGSLKGPGIFCMVIFSIANFIMTLLIISYNGEMEEYDETRRDNLTKLIDFNGCSDSETRVSSELVENTSVATNAAVIQVLLSIVVLILLARFGVWLYFMYLTYGNKSKPETQEQEMSDLQGIQNEGIQNDNQELAEKTSPKMQKADV